MHCSSDGKTRIETLLLQRASFWRPATGVHAESLASDSSIKGHASLIEKTESAYRNNLPALPILPCRSTKVYLSTRASEGRRCR